MTDDRPHPPDAELVDAITASPIGAYVLGQLVGEVGLESVADLPSDDLVVALADAAASCAPFSGFDSSTHTPRYVDDIQRCAEALVEAHRAVLVAPVDLCGQWRAFEGEHRSKAPYVLPPMADRHLFDDLSKVYECGEFPERAWKTHDPFPDEAVRSVLAGDDSFLDPLTSLWHFPVVGRPIVHEIVMPADWMTLLERGALFSRVQFHAPWDCDVVAVGDDGLATIETADGRTLGGVRGLMMPDWTEVAAEFDAVHFTWAGILTTEARFLDCGDGWFTTVRHWGTPSTRWFRDVFGPAEPLPVPSDRWLHGRSPEADRQRRDREIMRWLFGPDSAVPGSFD